MTSKDLMIGDWYAFRGHPYKCTARDIASIAECEEKGAPTDISEIPLTAEILEKNGFYLNGIEDHNNPSCDIDYGKWSYENEDGFDVVGDGTDIKYVRQLQHALRLCGIEHEIIL